MCTSEGSACLDLGVWYLAHNKVINRTRKSFKGETTYTLRTVLNLFILGVILMGKRRGLVGGWKVLFGKLCFKTFVPQVKYFYNTFQRHFSGRETFKIFMIFRFWILDIFYDVYGGWMSGFWDDSIQTRKYTFLFQFVFICRNYKKAQSLELHSTYLLSINSGNW